MNNLQSPIAQLALLVWPIITLVSFKYLTFRKAVLYSMLAGWLFLPICQIQIQGFFDITKPFVILTSLLAIVALRELSGRKPRPTFRFKWFDSIPVLFVLTYVCTTISKNLGIYEFTSYFIQTGLEIIFPYFLGRLYFSTKEDHSMIASAFLLSAFVYIPFCLYEIRLSPQLHSIVYGYQQHSFGQTYRMSGWRPLVFMRHGLELSMFLAVASVIGTWLVRTRTIVSGFPILGVGTIIIVTLLCKSTGALVLMVLAITTIFLCGFFRTAIPLLVFALLPNLYVTNRVFDWNLEKVVLEEVISPIFPLQRQRSLRYRIRNENRVANYAKSHFYFGRGRERGTLVRMRRQGTFRERRLERAREYLEGRSLAAADLLVVESAWAIQYGVRGIVGLSLYLSMFLIPVFGLYRFAKAKAWKTREFAPSAALAIASSAVAYDCLLNNYASYPHYFIIGALAYPIMTSRKKVVIVEEIISEGGGVLEDDLSGTQDDFYV